MKLCRPRTIVDEISPILGTLARKNLIAVELKPMPNLNRHVCPSGRICRSMRLILETDTVRKISKAKVGDYGE